MSSTLTGSMIGVNFGITSYFILGMIAIVFILIVVLLFIFVRIKKVEVDDRTISVSREDLSRSGLAKKKREGKYFWD